MTDKEQIINNCKLYKDGLCISPLGDEIKCENISIDKCYFKQKIIAEQERDRKTQECEQKEKELLSNEKIINKLMKEVDELKQECDTLKSQLDFEVQQKECIKQECEELKRKLSNQEQLYQNEIEIYNESCLQLRQENDDLYLERLALNTANSGINSLLEIKEQENTRYRNALEEIEEVWEKDKDGDYDFVKRQIFNIINKVKGEKKCQ